MKWWGAAAAVLALAACDADARLHRMQAREPRTAIDPPAGAVEWGARAEAPAPAPVLTRELLARGEERYDVACAACHGVLGDGDSDVARAMRGRKPPSLVDAAAVATSDVRIRAAIVVGYGAMPALGDLLAPRDRDAVLAFVRALQHREVAIDALAPPGRAAALHALAGSPRPPAVAAAVRGAP